jgi:hypothetical protein
MPLARLPWALLCLAALAALSACGSSSPTTPSTGLRSIITLTVAPNPIVSTITNPLGPVYTATWIVTLTESGTVGGVVQSVKATVFDNASGHLVASTAYDDKDLIVFVGKNRIEASGTLAVPLQVSYVLSTVDRAASLTVTTVVKDDKGNLVESSILVKIQ